MLVFSFGWQLYLYNIILTAKLFVYSHFIISKPPVRRLTCLCVRLWHIIISKPPMRRLTKNSLLRLWWIFSKPPMRRLTFLLVKNLRSSFSKPPMRRLTSWRSRCRLGSFSKPPMRRLTAIISPQSLISCHLTPIILPFNFFLGNHKIPYHNCLHNL